MKIESLHSLFLKYPNISTDTRKIKENDIFFALKGDNFNGNTYTRQALKKGASYVVIDEKEFKVNEKTIVVKDVIQTLQQLANFHRNYSNAKIISLTGSNGKTTTKELIYAVLAKKFNTVATKGNLNNHIGVPLTLLSIKPETEIAIVEMGANHQREISFLCDIAEPDFGYITNFGKAHLEGFGGVQGVIKGKSELYDYLKAKDKTIFLNADDAIQIEKLEGYPNKIGLSTNKTGYYNIQFISASPFVKLKVNDIEINTQLIGAYNFTNCCAAILMGHYFNVELADVKNALEKYSPDNNRSQIINQNGFHIVLDAYNANPSSMTVALKNFSLFNDKKKVLFLGDMFELGSSAKEEHQAIADLTQSLGFDDVYLVGENFYKSTTSFRKFEKFENLRNFLNSHQLPKDISILIKGSRGMALERILEII
ncbi:MAG: UDP-N-acetylmuramoyl-tripeptide--D-alanyl-D-alanine ligase [Maribacter sp.]